MGHSKEVISKVGDALESVFKLDFSGAKKLLMALGLLFATMEKRQQTHSKRHTSPRCRQLRKSPGNKDSAVSELQAIGDDVNGLPAGPDPSPIAGTLGGIGGGAEKADRIKNINVVIEKVVDHFTIETTNMQESAERIKDMVAEVLVSAINDINYAV